MATLRPYLRAKRQPTWQLTYNLGQGRKRKHLHLPKAEADRQLVRYQALEDLARNGHPVPGQPAAPLQLADAVEEFFRARKRLAPGTIRKYRQALGRFGDQIGPMFNLHQLRRQHVARFTESLTDLAPATINSILRHIKAFLRWLHQEVELLDSVPHVKMIEEPRRPPPNTVIG